MSKNKDIVKYHNDLNSITFYRFGQIDFDLFMSICSGMAEKGESVVSIGFDELKQMSGFNSHWSEKKFVDTLDSMGGKQLLSQGRIEKDNKITRFQLFPEMTIDEDNRTLTVKANEKYLYILNDLKKNFTRFELQEFISLDSKYSKTLYRLLKQYRTTGVYITTIDEFKRLLGVTKGYSNRLIMDKIINPSIKSLQSYFDNLSCEVQYEAKRGRPVKGYKFTFTPEKVQKQLKQGDDQKQHTKKKTGNKFHNFEQREYSSEDMQALERMLNNH